MHASPDFKPQSRLAGIRYKKPAVTIRRATTADASTVANMGRRLLPAAHQGALPPADLNLYVQKSFTLAYVAKELQHPNVNFWLAEIGREAAGMVKMEPALMPGTGWCENPIELSRLYLESQWIGQGVGSTLMRHALKQAAQAGHDICWLMVWSKNYRAIDFYRRVGFNLADTLHYPVGQSFLPAHIMVCQLSI